MRRNELEAMTTRELLALIEAAREVIGEREHPPEGAPSRKLVGRRGRAGRWLQSELVKCGKPGCHKDREGAGHGPYWYLYYTNEKTGRYTSRYVGKALRPELAAEFGLPPGSTAAREGAEDQEAAGDRHRDT